MYCYPVKGCAGLAVTETVMTHAGLAHDREFMVVSEEGDHRTQRTHPRLTLIRPEDTVRQVGIGEAELGYAKLAIRCVVTNVDQYSGVKLGPEPLRSLAQYRRAHDGGLAFGAKFAVIRAGELAVGDTMTIRTWGTSEL